MNNNNNNMKAQTTFQSDHYNFDFTRTTLYLQAKMNPNTLFEICASYVSCDEAVIRIYHSLFLRQFFL